jgi:hypothetical protein
MMKFPVVPDGDLRCANCDAITAKYLAEPEPLKKIIWRCDACLKREAEGRSPGLTANTIHEMLPGETRLQQSPVYHEYPDDAPPDESISSSPAATCCRSSPIGSIANEPPAHPTACLGV